MYLRTTQRRNKDGSVVRYYALAENVRHPGKGYVEARVVHSFGRADRLDRAALERLVANIRRILEEGSGEAGARAGSSGGRIAIEAAFELGVVHVAEALWARLGIGEPVQARVAEKRLQAPHAAALLAMVAQRLATGRAPSSPATDAGSSGCGCPRRATSACTSSTAPWTSWPCTAMPSSRRCSGGRSICSSSTSTWSSMMAPRPGSRVTRRTSPARSGAGSPSSLCASAGTARKAGTTTCRW